MIKERRINIKIKNVIFNSNDTHSKPNKQNRVHVLCKVVLMECYKLSKNVVRVVFKKWSDLSSKIGPSCLYKVVRADLKMGPSRPGKVVRFVFKSGQSWPKKWSDFTLNIGPSCPRKVVRVVLKKWSELSIRWSELSIRWSELSLKSGPSCPVSAWILLKYFLEYF